MWVRRAAIPPVPSYARVEAANLERVELWLIDDDAEGEERLSNAFARFEQTQSALSSRVATALAKKMDETALALGYMLTLAVWMSFEEAFADRLGEVSEQDLEAAHQAIALDEEMRQNAPDEAVDTDDVMAMEQPELVEFVREHVDVALETHAKRVDLDDVDTIYRLVLMEVMVLSYAVRPPEQFPPSNAEWTA